MLTPVASLFWFAEIILEVIGSRYAFRRRIVPLGVYLGFRAVADVVCMGIYQFCSQGVYAWADLIQRTGQYLLFWALAVFLCCKLFDEDRYTTRTYLGIFTLIGIAAIVYFHARPLTMGRLRDFEFGAQGAAAVFMGAAFFMLSTERSMQVNRVWEWLGYALLVKAGWDILVTGLIAHGWHGESLYPIGALSALGMWAWALWDRPATVTPADKGGMPEKWMPRV